MLFWNVTECICTGRSIIVMYGLSHRLTFGRLFNLFILIFRLDQHLDYLIICSYLFFIPLYIRWCIQFHVLRRFPAVISCMHAPEKLSKRLRNCGLWVFSTPDIIEITYHLGFPFIGPSTFFGLAFKSGLISRATSCAFRLRHSLAHSQTMSGDLKKTRLAEAREKKKWRQVFFSSCRITQLSRGISRQNWTHSALRLLAQREGNHYHPPFFPAKPTCFPLVPPGENTSWRSWGPTSSNGFACAMGRNIWRGTRPTVEKSGWLVQSFFQSSRGKILENRKKNRSIRARVQHVRKSAGFVRGFLD